MQSAILSTILQDQDTTALIISCSAANIKTTVAAARVEHKLCNSRQCHPSPE
jgi:hypothetical protein